VTLVDIAAWLRQLGLERYEEAFRENEIDAEILPKLTADDLKDLGVTTVGHRRKLLEAIAALAEPASVPQVVQSAPAEAAPRAVPRDAERRHLSVMFIDLVGSTELSGRLDPEDMHAVIGSYQNAVAGEVTRFEGYVAKFMGDGVLAYFGWPRAHEDDAERAVRAGLAITAAVARLEGGGAPLGCRVGIATGLVVVGDLVGQGAAQEEAVVGDTPNLAARLQALAPPGQVVIAGSTRRLIGDLFELDELRARPLKGIEEPVPLFAVRAERQLESRFAARAGGPSLMPIVGREQELALLRERWQQAKAGEGQMVLLGGEAGIGKSRITEALVQELSDEPCTRIRYQCSPYHGDSALWPVIQQLGHAAGFVAGEPNEARLDKLEVLLARASDEPKATAALIADLLGLDDQARYGALNLTPQAQRAQTLEALVQQLLGLANRQPVLVVLEDAHWVDPTTLELMEQCLDRIADARVLMLLTSRPDHQSELAGHPHVTRLTLNRLGRAGVHTIVKRLGGEALSVEVIDAIIDRTDGVPLFVEELTKAVLEAGEASIPASLHDSLMARLDRIPEVKEVAQIAACIGREFSHDLLAAVADHSDADLGAALDRLASAELIFRRGKPPDARYTFKHALVRDTAYASLLRSRRQNIHGRIAEALEQRFQEGAALEPELLGRHLTEADRVVEAIPYWQKAGEEAARRSANVEAIAHLNETIGLLERLPDTQQRRHHELSLQTSLAGSLIATRGYGAPETAKVFERAQQLAEEVDDSALFFPTVYGQWVYAIICAEHAKALELAQRFVRLAKGQSATGPLLIARRVLGVTLFELGRTMEARDALESALSLYEPSEHDTLKLQFGQDPRAAGLSFLAVTLFELGHADQARAAAKTALAHVEQLNHANSLGYTLTYGALTLSWCLSDVAGVARTAEHLTTAEKYGMALWLAYARIFRGWATVMHDRTEAGLALIHQGLDALEATGTLLHRSHCLGMLAQALSTTGAHSDALRVADEALALAERQQEAWIEPELFRIKGSLVLGSDGDPVQAATRFERSIALSRERGTKSWELRAARDLARLWAERGERRKAHDLLAPIYGWFTEGFDTADLKDAKVLLDELGRHVRGNGIGIRVARTLR
jgi:class 3 adenylate cyclase/predicted ATPase